MMYGWVRFGRSLAALILGGVALGSGGGAGAAEYPNRQLTIVVPFAPGGLADVLARRIAPRLSEKHKIPVIVDNRAGAGGSLGARAVVSAPGDGYTLLLASSGITTEPALRKDVPYNMATDLAAVTKVAQLPQVVLVNAAFAPKTLSELVAHAKANPGTINVGSSGSGSATHFAAELFKSVAGVDVVHVPYKGGAPSWQAVMAGEVQLLFDPISSARKLVDSKKVRALALAAPRRSDYWPDLPTAAEAGLPGYEADIWFGIFAPGKTPPALVKDIHAMILGVLGEPEMRSWLAQQGFTMVGNAPEAFAAANAIEVKRWTELVRANKITAD
jgi:tripartite-type tricarboxylate transporter receptor subunit TctC